MDRRGEQYVIAVGRNSTEERNIQPPADGPSGATASGDIDGIDQTSARPEGPLAAVDPDGPISDALQSLLAQSPLETAADPIPKSGGGSRYEDGSGSVLELLEAESVIPPTELSFSPIVGFGTNARGPLGQSAANSGFPAAGASNQTPVADPVFSVADDSATPAALSAVMTEIGENPASVVAFRSLSVDNEISDSDDRRDADFGGSDAESDLSALLFNLDSDPSLGRLFARGTDGVVHQLTAAGDTDGDPFTASSFREGDEIWWITTIGELTPDSGNAVRAGGLGASLSDWTDSGVQISARDFDGSAGAVALNHYGIGVDGGSPAPTQINHDSGTGESQALEITLPGPAISAEITISNLFPDEGPGGAGETGIVKVLHGDTQIGAFTFGDRGDDPSLDFDLPSNVGRFTLNEDALGAGQVFDILIFEALDYAGGAFRAGDSSDYFVRQIVVTEADYSDSFSAADFSYRVTDEAGNSSASVPVAVQRAADPGGQTFVVDLSFDGVSVDSGADEVLGGLTPGDNLVFHDILDLDGNGEFSLEELLPHVSVVDEGFGEDVTVSFDGGGQVTLSGIGTGANDTLQSLMDQGIIVTATA